MQQFNVSTSSAPSGDVETLAKTANPKRTNQLPSKNKKKNDDILSAAVVAPYIPTAKSMELNMKLVCLEYENNELKQKLDLATAALRHLQQKCGIPQVQRVMRKKSQPHEELN